MTAHALSARVLVKVFISSVLDVCGQFLIANAAGLQVAETRACVITTMVPDSDNGSVCVLMPHTFSELDCPGDCIWLFFAVRHEDWDDEATP
jgi:hypothetical protein